MDGFAIYGETRTRSPLVQIPLAKQAQRNTNGSPTNPSPLISPTRFHYLSSSLSSLRFPIRRLPNLRRQAAAPRLEGSPEAAAMAATAKYNRSNPAVKRILQEVKEMQSNPSPDFMALPLEVPISTPSLTLSSRFVRSDLISALIERKFDRYPRIVVIRCFRVSINWLNVSFTYIFVLDLLALIIHLLI